MNIHYISNLWTKAGTVLRGKIIAVTAYLTTGATANKNTKYTPQETRKRSTIKPKVSRRKEITKIRVRRK